MSSSCLRGNHVQGESKDINLDLFLTPESIAFFQLPLSLSKQFSGGAGFLGFWDSGTAQIILQALTLPQDSVRMFESAQVATQACVLVFF